MLEGNEIRLKYVFRDKYGDKYKEGEGEEELPNERLSRDQRSGSMVGRARLMAQTPLTSLP